MLKVEVDGHNDHQPPRASTAVRLSEVYIISPGTIRRDSELASALDAIGEHSVEAKRRILSDEIEVTRKQLREVAAGSENYIAEPTGRLP